MCTEVCPCLEYNQDTPKGNPKLKYHMHLEVYMKKYGRSNYDKKFSRDNHLKPMYWTDNVNQGYKSFMECYQHWEDRA